MLPELTPEQLATIEDMVTGYYRTSIVQRVQWLEPASLLQVGVFITTNTQHEQNTEDYQEKDNEELVAIQTNLDQELDDQMDVDEQPEAIFNDELHNNEDYVPPMDFESYEADGLESEYESEEELMNLSDNDETEFWTQIVRMRANCQGCYHQVDNIESHLGGCLPYVS